MGFETLSLLILLYVSIFCENFKVVSFPGLRDIGHCLKPPIPRSWFSIGYLFYMEIIITPEIGIGFTSNLQQLLIFISQFETHTENLGTTS